MEEARSPPPHTPPFDSPQYLLPNSTKLKIEGEENNVTNTNGEIVFSTKKPLGHLRVLCGASGAPIFTLYKKFRTVHGRWKVYLRDGGGGDKDLRFSVLRPSVIPDMDNVELDVFLAENKKESVYDFKVKADSNKKTCEIYARGSRQVLAKMEIDGDMEVWVDAYVHHAFIVALLMIVDSEIKFFDKVKKVIKIVGVITPLVGVLTPICGAELKTLQ